MIIHVELLFFDLLFFLGIALSRALNKDGVSWIKVADCNVPEKLIEVGSCEMASECVHHPLCRVREELNGHNLRSEAEEKEGWAYEAAICILMHDSQCQGISSLSAQTTDTLAEIQILCSLFPHIKEA